jgi:beta-glucanase (GH16 family)
LSGFAILAGKGLWPAFWMLPNTKPPTASTLDCLGCGDYGGWPASGELDIMETKDDMQFVSSAGGAPLPTL